MPGYAHHTQTSRTANPYGRQEAADPASSDGLRASLREMSFEQQQAALSPNQGAGGGIVQLSTNGQPLLISFEKVDQTFTAWVKSLAAARGKPENDMGVLKDALTRTKTQVGSLNFSNYMSQGGGMYVGPITYREIKAPQPSGGGADADADPLDSLYGGLDAQAASMLTKANNLNSGVVHAEYFTHKLKSPEGAKGIAYQITAGTLGQAATAYRGVDKAKKKVDVAGQAIDKGVDKALGIKDKPKPTFEEEGADLVEDGHTSIKIMTGKLHDLYKQTRPSYNSFQAAYDSFLAAYSAYNKANELMEISTQVGAMKTALDKMREAARSYLMLVEALGIPREAARVDKLSAAIVDAQKLAVADAVGKLGGPLGEVGDKAGEAAARKTARTFVGDPTDRIQENASQLASKAVGKGTGLATKVPQKAVERAAQD